MIEEITCNTPKIFSKYTQEQNRFLKIIKSSLPQKYYKVSLKKLF